MATNTVIVCPGQGSQKVGMCADFMENSHARELMERADDTLSFNLSRLMLTGEQDELTLTQNAQPALFLASFICWDYLHRASGAHLPSLASYVAGHSLGEYSALTIAGVFSFEDGLKLVQKRGCAMNSALKAGEGAMVAVLGMSIEAVNNACLQHNVWVANDNTKGQVVISGKTADIAKCSAYLKESGAKRIIPLNVSGAFHTPLMAPAAEIMEKALDEVSMYSPSVAIIQNITARAESDINKLQSGLVNQITSQVCWRETMIFLQNNGIKELCEVGAGNVLSSMTRRVDGVDGIALNSPQVIDEYLENKAKKVA